METIGVFLGSIDEYLYAVQLFVLAIFLMIFLLTPSELYISWLFLPPSDNRKAIDSVEMIGQPAKVLNWDNKKGQVSLEGEIWKAKSKDVMALSRNDEVFITQRDKMTLIVAKG